ncbi:hypothetical protein ACJX0J_037060, partial [Zea mays]
MSSVSEIVKCAFIAQYSIETNLFLMAMGFKPIYQINTSSQAATLACIGNEN